MHLRSSGGFWGPERVIFELARGAPERTVVVCFAERRNGHGPLLGRVAGVGARTGTVPSRQRLDPGSLTGLLGLVRATRPDLVHSHDYKSDTLAVLAGRLLAVPVVATAHTWHRHTRALRLYERVDQIVLRGFRGVAAVSEEIAATLRARGVRRERVRVIHNGVDTREFRPCPDRRAPRAALGLPPDGPLVAVCGRLAPEKGHALLLRALAAVSAALPDVRLAVAGSGELAGELAQEARRLGIAGRTHWLGTLEQPRSLYCAAEVYVQPSLQEGLPLTVLEAAACGAAVVATAAGDVPRVVVPGETGLLVPVGDAKVLAEAIRSLLADAGLAGRLGDAARRLVSQRFDADAMREGYRAFYATALAPRCPA